MSDEHVIPDSLGGCYHVYNVCKTCNSAMGHQVDSPLVNHKLAELYRFCEEIRGKSGGVPNPFAGVFFEKANPEVKARVGVGQDGKLELHYHPVIRVKENDGVVQSIEIEVDSKEEQRIDEIIKKIAKRKGIPEAAIVNGERRRQIRVGGVGGSWQVDTLRFKIGLLKIAYEFAVESVPAYFDDADALKISKILAAADYEAATEYVKIGSGLNPEILEPFGDFLDLSSKKHYLVLTNSDMGLLCLIKLHEVFAVGVVLTDKNYLSLDETIFGINDISNKSFRKVGIVDAIRECTGPAHTRFCYYFPDERAAALGRAEVSRSGYRYEELDKGIPLYNKRGELLPIFVHELMEVSPSQRRRDESWIIDFFEFNPSDEFFIKAVASGNLHRVVGFELSREIMHRL